MRRMFLVGTPRSGTTLLQSFLAAHPSIVTIPETHFFFFLHRTHQVPNRLGLAPTSALERLRLSVTTAYPDYAMPMPRSLLGHTRRDTAVRTFVDTIDDLARGEGATAWVEKTPRHLLCLDEIRSSVRGAWVIHLIRSGDEVAESMHRVSTQSPERWNGARSLRMAAERWKRDVELAVADRDSSNTVFVRYGDLVNDTAAVLTALCQALGLPPDEAMMTGREDALSKVILRDVHWHDSVKSTEVGAHKGPADLDLSDIADIVDSVDISWCRGVVRGGVPAR